jgi:beta-lactamase class A
MASGGVVARRSAVAAISLAAAVAVGVPVPAAGSAAGVARPHHQDGAGDAHRRCRPIFTSSFVASLHRRFPTQRVTASIQDVRDGCTYHLHPAMRITTASVIKAQVLGAVLLKAQGEHRHLDARERHDIHPMIRWSYNNPYVPDLYNDVGGVAGMDRFDSRMHARHTVNTEEYGATVTTSNDRTHIVRRMLYGGGPLRAAYRRIAWRYMSDVTPTQRWGITAGIRQGWTVALKNGFYPMPGRQWRVGSTGFLRAPGRHRGYAITVMTDEDRTQVAGIRLVQQVARRVAAVLSGGPKAHRVVDRARCLTVLQSTSWPAVARRLATTDSRGVRRVSGGNPDPLFGQRVCSPRLRRKAA